MAEKDKAVDAVQADFQVLQDIIKSSNDFRAFLAAPSLGVSQQSGVVEDVCTKAKFHKLTTNFLGVLAHNRRLNALEGIIKTFQKLIAKRAGHVEVRVETAQALSDAQKKDLQSKIEGAVGSGVTLEARVTPEILGGMIVTIGSNMVDDSVRRKIERLGAVMKSNANQNTNQNLKEVV